MDIAALSTSMTQATLKSAVSISVAKLALDTISDQAQDNAKMLEQSVQPHKGQSVDIKL